jgi:hypothetical protein
LYSGVVCSDLGNPKRKRWSNSEVIAQEILQVPKASRDIRTEMRKRKRREASTPKLGLANWERAVGLQERVRQRHDEKRKEERERTRREEKREKKRREEKRGRNESLLPYG